MNFNGNQVHFEHAVSVLRNPERRGVLQSELNKKRFARVEKSLSTRPVYIPLQLTLPANGQLAPITARTPYLAYDTIVIGIISDAPNRQILLKRLENDVPFVYTGDSLNTYATLDEFSGKSALPGGGQIGAFYLPSPITVEAGNRLLLDVFKFDDTDEPEIVNITFIAYRVFRQGLAESLLGEQQKRLVEFYIKARTTPEIRLLKQEIIFSSEEPGGIAKRVSSPEVEEPLLIRGVRSSLNFGTIEIEIEGEPSWTTSPTPIWALAAQTDDAINNYRWLERPVFLPAKSQLEMKFVNTSDGVYTDGATGTITFICETM